MIQSTAYRLVAPLTLIGVVSLAVGCSTTDAADGLADALHQATQANMANDLGRQRRVLRQAERIEGDPDDAAEVQRRLALIEWRYDLDDDRARERLRKATRAAEPERAWLALAELEQNRERFDAAAAAAVKAREAATKEMHRREADLAWATAVVHRAIAARRAGRAGIDADLKTARTQLEREVRAEIGLQQHSMLLLHAALLLDDGETARLAFRSFYQITPGSPAPSAIRKAAGTLLRRLKDWRGPDAGTRQRIVLIEALDGTRLFVAAALIARDPRADAAVRDHPAVHETLTYLDFTDRLRNRIDEHYRRCLVGECKGGRQKRDREGELDRFVKELKGDHAAPFRGDVLDFIERRFGGHVNVGWTAGYPDTHYGHSVIDERRTVEQYGHRADLRYVSLDHMVSNGFQSWAWEGGAQHGGWADSTAIYQVRAAYLPELMTIARAIDDGEERREFEEQLREETARDEERARADPHAFLPGLKRRLQWQAFQNVLGRVRGGLQEGDDLRLRFLQELERAGLDSAIFAHEGRHAIDARGANPDGPTWRKEYRAKLSEVAFAPEPRIAVAGIISADIGDDSPHGQANLKIVENLVAWMDGHRDAIEGLDGDRPLLPQLDLLTDDQLRAVFRGMDPLAKARS